MALEHRFLLISIEDKSVLQDINFYDRILDDDMSETCSVLLNMVINDNIISCFADYLAWVPGKNYYDDSQVYGLNRDGITLYDAESQKQLYNILKSIKALFDNAPDMIKLRGDVYVTENEVVSYETVEIKKECFMKNMCQMIDAVAQLGKQNSYLIHLGV